MRILILYKDFPTVIKMKESLQSIKISSVFFEPESEDLKESLVELQEFITRQDVTIALVGYKLWANTTALNYIPILNSKNIPFIAISDRLKNLEIVSAGAYYDIDIDSLYDSRFDKKKFEFEMRKAITLQKRKKV